MKYNTRLNPTISGSQLHCGHLYLALVNVSEAHRSGGKFIVRIDDTQEYWKHNLGQKLIDQFNDIFHEQLCRFMDIDKWERQSSLPKAEEIIAEHYLPAFVPKERWLHDQVAEWIQDPEMMMYPYAPRYTLEKVIWDFSEGVNWLIRGEDLVVETSLYDFFVDIIGIPRMRHTYVPRLRAKDREEISVTAISKTFRNYQLQTQIDQFGIDGTLEFLKQSCLVDIDKGFFVENIKWNPTIVGLKP
jgi:glutamyl/glutaminyl-tRNA synthetase